MTIFEIVRKRDDIDLDNITKTLNTILPNQFESTPISGLLKYSGFYVSLKVLRDGRPTKKTDDNSLWQLDLELFHEGTNPLDGLTGIDYLLKAYAIDNHYYPRWHGMDDSQTDEDLINFFTSAFNRYLNDTDELNKVELNRLSGATARFTVYMNDEKEPVNVLLEMDTDKRVGYYYHSNNEVIGRKYLYQVNLSLADTPTN